MQITNENKTIKDLLKGKFQNLNLSEDDIIDLTIELSAQLNIELNKRTSKLS